MSQISRTFKNMGWLFISQIISSICGFVWTILIARYLGVTGNGILGFAISFAGIVGIAMDLGVGTHIMRHIATNNDSASKYIGNAIPLKTIFSTITLIISFFILLVMGCDALTLHITILFIIQRIFISLTGIFNGAFQAFEKAKYSAIANVIQTILLLIFIIIVIYGNLNIYGLATAYLVAYIFATVYEYAYIKKEITNPKFELDISFCKEITIAAIPFAITGFFYVIYYSIDMIMLTNFVGAYATGIYNASYKLISVLNALYSVYPAVIFPVMSRLFKNEKTLLKTSFEKSIKYLMIIMIPLAFLTTLYSTEIILLFFGKEFIAASSNLKILIWTVCLLFINGACTNFLNASYKEKLVTRTYVIAAIFNFVLNLYMIPNYSYNGAAVSTVLSDILITIIFIYLIHKLIKLNNKNAFFDLIKIVICSIISYLTVFYLNIDLIVGSIVGIIIYLILILIFKIIDEQDRFIIKEIVNRN